MQLKLPLGTILDEGEISITESALPEVFGRQLRKWYTTQQLPRYRVISLFSGGGGLDIAFHDAGFEVIEMVEKDTSCIKTLNYNSQPGGLLQGANGICINVEKYEPNLDHQIDFVIGGPPCQSFSAAGRRMAGVLGTSAPEGKLFHDYVRILKRLQPSGFLFENVLGLLSAQKGTAWRTMREAFLEAGYTPFVHVMDAADYGVPQHRERVIVIGLRSGSFCFPAPTHGPRAKSGQAYITAKQVLQDVLVSVNDLPPAPPTGRYGHLLKDIPPGLNYSYYTERMGHPQPVFSWRSKFSDFLYKADPDEPTRTIKANGGTFSGPFHWEGRSFTITELKRLQTFPDEYHLCGGRRATQRQLGNAVPPQLGRILALALREQLFGEIIPVALDYLPIGDDTRLHRQKHLKTALYIAKASNISKTSKSVAAVPEPNFSETTTWEVIRYLTSSYGWQQEYEAASLSFLVKAYFEESIWTIQLEHMNDAESKSINYTLVLTAASGHEWPLKASAVHLQATDCTERMFTACWKAFEEILRQKAHLVDLIQLSGYYYYPQRLAVRLLPQANIQSLLWLKVVERVSAGLGVGRIMDEASLAGHWDISIPGVSESLLYLRRLGFEVRSHNINPQIPEGEYLVPYSFPTLNPYSPQRRKPIEILKNT